MTADVETLRNLRPLVVTLLARMDDALGAASDPDLDLRRGKTPNAILRLFATVGPMKPGEIAERLRDAGRDVSDAAVYQACVRHVRDGALRRVGPATYDLAEGAANDTARAAGEGAS